MYELDTWSRVGECVRTVSITQLVKNAVATLILIFVSISTGNIRIKPPKSTNLPLGVGDKIANGLGWSSRACLAKVKIDTFQPSGQMLLFQSNAESPSKLMGPFDQSRQI